MKFQFDSVDEYEVLYSSIHDSIIYWKKVRQMCQGKINLNVDPDAENHYDEKYAIDKIIENGLLLKSLEDSPHPIWNDEINGYVLGVEEYNSHIVEKIMKMVPKTSLAIVEDCVGG